MHNDIQAQMHEIEELRLPELQARFAEIVGEPTRTPNKQYLLRRIAEALEAKQTDDGAAEGDDTGEHAADGITATEPECTDDDGDVTTEPESTDGDDAGEPTTTTDLTAIKLTKLTIPELQERYRQTLRRETRSRSVAYLVWKIRQAEKGRVRIGPVHRRTAEGEFKVLPLRMPIETVTALDEARVRLGLKSRMELIRRALQAYLEQAGETDVAALFAKTDPNES